MMTCLEFSLSCCLRDILGTLPKFPSCVHKYRVKMPGKAIRKETTKQDGNVFDAIGERVSDPMLRKSEGEIKKSNKVAVSPPLASSSTQPAPASKMFDHVCLLLSTSQSR